GTVNISLTASLPIVLKSFERHDFIVLAGFVSSSQDIKVLGMGKSISDLEGKKVGLPVGTTPQFLMDTCLEYHKLTDVEIVDVRSQDALNELKNDDVHAVAVWQPYAFEIERAMDVTGYCSEVYYRSTLSFVSLNRINKEAARRFLEAIRKANTFFGNIRKMPRRLLENICN
ncbi:MAG TPA: ABC transporter substrate-binding protein, partial [Candidatus Nanoarchaeia archaeon]|nr:ABC transporter substrate-binding protein [Candidatus Nanoarchaeia archaeon]